MKGDLNLGDLRVICPACWTSQPATEFVNKRRTGKWASWCRTCQLASRDRRSRRDIKNHWKGRGNG